MSKFVGDDEEAEAIIRSLKEAPSMNANPWLDLPVGPQYVLPKDKEAIEEFNRTAGPDHFLHIDKILPEPFVGSKDAPILLLSNNPGFSENEEKLRARQSPRFRELMRKNLNHGDSDYPFVFLHPDLESNDNGDGWWQRRLRHLIDKFGTQAVARSVLNVVYFPYPSREYGHQRLHLPSHAQEYSFDLVRNAVERKAVVVLLRSGKGNQKAWLEAVPKLNGYDWFHLGSNPRAPHISPGNCPGFFDNVVEAIATFLKSRTACA